MSGEDEAKLSSEWQKRLGLTDWKIAICSGLEQDEMEIKEAEGCAIYEESTKSALIQIAKESTRPPKASVREYDFEETLVHELLHLKFSLLDTNNDSDLQSRVLHQLIDDMARALVDAKRSKGDGKDE